MFLLMLPGAALILLGILYLRKGLLKAPPPYRQSENGVSEHSASRQKTADFAAGVALLIAGIVLIVASLKVPSGLF